MRCVKGCDTQVSGRGSGLLLSAIALCAGGSCWRGPALLRSVGALGMCASSVVNRDLQYRKRTCGPRAPRGGAGRVRHWSAAAARVGRGSERRRRPGSCALKQDRHINSQATGVRLLTLTHTAFTHPMLLAFIWGSPDECIVSGCGLSLGPVMTLMPADKVGTSSPTPLCEGTPPERLPPSLII